MAAPLHLLRGMPAAINGRSVDFLAFRRLVNQWAREQGTVFGSTACVNDVRPSLPARPNLLHRRRGLDEVIRLPLPLQGRGIGPDGSYPERLPGFFHSRPHGHRAAAPHTVMVEARTIRCQRGPHVSLDGDRPLRPTSMCYRRPHRPRGTTPARAYHGFSDELRNRGLLLRSRPCRRPGRHLPRRQRRRRQVHHLDAYQPRRCRWRRRKASSTWSPSSDPVEYPHPSSARS